MSSDGKVIVYEDGFGIWKLDVATGKTNEIKLDIASDEKQNEVELDTVTNDVDSFDLSPSGRRAVISARGQIFTIATERGGLEFYRRAASLSNPVPIDPVFSDTLQVGYRGEPWVSGPPRSCRPMRRPDFNSATAVSRG